jgi:hypothetical protein
MGDHMIWLWGVLGLLALHFLLLWLERKGLLYYRSRLDGGASSVLLEMEKALKPEMVHVQEAKERMKNLQAEEMDDNRPKDLNDAP